MDHPRRYWMWAKRKSQWMESWEEAAFAEDASRGLEGCVWPQRCYACSFCKREFRSAQALGGHMNIHRRDRARLKQSTTEDVQRVIRVSSPPPVPKVMVVGEEESVTAHDHGVVPSCKRIKTDGKHTCFNDTIPQLEVMKHCSSPVEDLDLELRLGEAPKLK